MINISSSKVLALLVLSVSAGMASAQFFSPDDFIPRAHYSGHDLVTYGSLPFQMSGIDFTIPDGVAPPTGGNSVIVTFSNDIVYTTYQGLISGSIKITDVGGGNYDTEFLQMDMGGSTFPSGYMVRESPTLASLGKTNISPTTGGFIITSFFDVFTELSIDGGQTWTPGSNSDRLNGAVPEPTSSTLLICGSLGLILKRRKKAKGL